MNKNVLNVWRVVGYVLVSISPVNIIQIALVEKTSPYSEAVSV